VKLELASEKSSKQEIAQSNVKMSSLLKVGQEALQQEQETVKKLQAQLEEAKKVRQQFRSTFCPRSQVLSRASKCGNSGMFLTNSIIN
jgi:homoserine dehydrogenase